MMELHIHGFAMPWIDPFCMCHAMSRLVIGHSYVISYVISYVMPCIPPVSELYQVSPTNGIPTSPNSKVTSGVSGILEVCPLAMGTAPTVGWKKMEHNSWETLRSPMI